MWLSDFVLNLVHAINNIRSNVWSVGLVAAGIFLIVHGFETAGTALVTGAFAVFRSSNTDTAPIPPNAAPPVLVVPPVKYIDHPGIPGAVTKMPTHVQPTPPVILNANGHSQTKVTEEVNVAKTTEKDV